MPARHPGKRHPPWKAAGETQMTAIQDNYNGILQTVAQACEHANRQPDEVRIVAVSKTVEPAQIEQAIQAKVQDFAENRVDKFQQRTTLFPGVNWHFIGHIQTNKLKHVVGRAALIHSLCSEHALQEIERLAARAGVVQKVLVEVNVSGEPSKDGLEARDVPGFLRSIEGMGHVQVCGLMTMAPEGDLQLAREVFVKLRLLRDSLATSFANCEQVCLNELSMGMSDDYVVAVEEGATIVRIGRRFWKEEV
jgi:pyridoxal phosphate enzyme (YggS family)